MAYRLGLGNISTPGPGFIPFGTATLLGLMSMGMVLSNLLGMIKAHRQEAVFEGVRWNKLVMVLGTLLGYGIFLDILGFSLCTFFLMMFNLRVVARRRWRSTVPFSIFVTVAAYLIFTWLGCEFPRGLWMNIVKP
jgi:hypothetical protein